MVPIVHTRRSRSISVWFLRPVSQPFRSWEAEVCLFKYLLNLMKFRHEERVDCGLDFGGF